MYVKKECKNMLWFLVILTYPIVESTTCGLLEIPDDVTQYNISKYSVEHSCSCNKCARKCCANGFAIQLKEMKCSRNTSGNSSISIYDHDQPLDDAINLDYIEGFLNCPSYILEPDIYEDDAYFLQPDGRLWFKSLNIYKDINDYCVDYIDNKSFTAFVCFEKGLSSEELYKRFNEISMIISMPFLLATFLVYAILPDRNLHGKALMCYVMSLLLAYIFLVTIILHEGFIEKAPCLTLAYLCYFFFVASFFWMNVMCVDLWWTFSGFRGFSGRKQSEKRRFILYNVYAWGIPLLLLSIAAILNEALDNNSSFSPKMGQSKCWFEDALSTLIYFYGVLAVLILFNIICFILTTVKIRQAKQDTAMLNKDESKRHSYQNDKQRFNLYLKLFLAMGVNWSMEIISWAVEWKLKTVPKEVFIVTDFCNALYGVFIFFIFVCNKEKQKKLQKWYYSVTGRPMRGQSMACSTSNPTRTTHAGSEKSVTNETILLTNNGNNH